MRQKPRSIGSKARLRGLAEDVLITGSVELYGSGAANVKGRAVGSTDRG
jgi:hypothetical protein